MFREHLVISPASTLFQSLHAPAMPVAYKPLSTHDPERDPHTDSPAIPDPNSHSARAKNLLLRLLLLAAVMYAAFRALGSIRPRMRTPCHIAPSHRNLSSLPSHYTLPSGDQIPAIALGVWQADPGQVGAAVKTALKTGYRHIDGAWIYRNEAEVGQAIKESGVPRDQLWLTSKLWNTFHTPEDVEPALDDTLAKLGTDYLDLYLVHWPIAFRKGTTVLDEGLTADPYPTWQALEEVVAKGKVRNIGISNFNIKRIQNLTANPLRVQPAVNQVELNFWNPQPELLKWSKAHGLLLEAYSPLGSAKQVQATLRAPAVQAAAAQLGITPAQAVVSWHVQRGTVVLPKSVTPARVEENFQVHALPDDLFAQLEDAAAAHPPQRVVNPSQGWGLGFDVFDDYPQ
ncbi:hypothetical protein AcW1_007203 [Taiwanofungus camphoratus]|nr:hypothetical protein AcW2_007727 [Antrodia cinnamomea]KAI0952825.1 hypothetical protein AcW1_007203 [Antrodia cinnamomea]